MRDRRTGGSWTTSAAAGSEEAEGKPGDSEDRYRALVEHGPAVVYIDAVDEASTAIYVSPQIQPMLGYAPEEWLADPQMFVKTLHPEDREHVLSENERTNRSGEPFNMEYRLVARDGRTVWVHDEAVLLRDEEGRSLYWQGILADVTERKGLERKLNHLAYHDPLTGLSNRILFREHLESALSRAERRRGHLAILYLDLDGFKGVNDSLGHEAGDLLLAAVGKRLESSSRSGDDTVARLGGDEFCVLLEGVAGTDEAMRLARRTKEVLRQPYAVDDHRISSISVSVGISMTGPAENKAAEQLLREADAALYMAKKKGKARCEMFKPGMALRVPGNRVRMEDDLRRAIEEAGFSLHYQPKVSLSTGTIISWEALARWERPDEERAVPPAEFVPLAEETGMIIPFGRWVLREACRQAKEWQERYPEAPVPTMNVNFSARQFHHPALVEEVTDILRETNLEASSLCIEITESTAMEDAPSTVSVLRELKDLGVKLAIDDFGVGYSSLSYLKRFPVDILKIDRSIIEGLERDAGNAAIASAAITLAHALGLEAVAEGVETRAEATELHALGCDFGQGYYWWEPRPAHAAAALLRSNVGRIRA